MNWIAKIPDLLLYPVGWYLALTEWVEDNVNKAVWCAVALIIVAWWL